MKTLIDGAGWFIWPLGVCSFLAVFIALERLFALQSRYVLPARLLTLLAQPNPPPLPAGLEKSAGGRIVRFFQRNNPDPETLKAYAQMELTRLERGVFLLDTTVGVAPLIGLLGTVYGLFALFPEEGMPTAANLTRGVGLALTTTIIGLLIAIPALVVSNYIYRRLEVFSARVNMLVERLCALGSTGVRLTDAIPVANGKTRAATAPGAAAGAEPPPLPSAAQQPASQSTPQQPAPAKSQPPPEPTKSAPPEIVLPRHVAAPPKLEFVLKPLASAVKPKLPPR
jgi:biopolymer transport protein ExbB